MTELKPCPFCGGEARLWHPKEYGITLGSVKCNSCGASTESFTDDDSAIEAWDTRPTPWHTGTPSEEGWYLVAYRKRDCDGSYFWDYDTRIWQLGEWNCSPYEFPIIKWQKIEEGEEVNNV